MTTTKHVRLVFAAIAVLTLHSPLAHAKGAGKSTSFATTTRPVSGGGVTVRTVLGGRLKVPPRNPAVVTQHTCTGSSHYCMLHSQRPKIIRDHRANPGPYTSN